MKKTRPNPRANKNILWFAYGVVGVFAAMDSIWEPFSSSGARM